MSADGDALRDDNEIVFGTVTLEKRYDGLAELHGFIRTGCFEDTGTDAVVVITTDTGRRDGAPEEQVLVPLHRVLDIGYDWQTLTENSSRGGSA